LGHIGFEGAARFNQPPVSDGNEKYRGDQGSQMGLSPFERGDEPRASDYDRYGFGGIRLLLGLEERDGKENEQRAKQRNSTMR